MVQISLQNSGVKVVFSGHQREYKYLGHLSVKQQIADLRGSLIIARMLRLKKLNTMSQSS